ncbi:MAG: TnsD family Tn7-like transposition protein [Cellvibrio sp.]|uniref:TnsD family Tn7-like transposition protein n=1 Tax=Cellvibrio sp. TaxID=1965322 RepID=UPI0031AEA6AE
MKSSASAFLPTYIVGESVYSWVARCHLCQTSSAWRSTNRFLFGTEHVRLHSVLPAHLAMISSHSHTPEETLLFNATGYSLFAYMQQSVEWAEKLRQALIAENGGRIATLASLCSSKLPFHSCLKFCPDCLEIDSVTEGTPYWHTGHQLYGVLSCPEHGLRLIEIPCGTGGIDHEYILPEMTKRRSQPAPKLINSLSKQIVSSHEFLNRYQKPIFPSNAYNLLLKERGYITEGGNLRWKSLQTDMQKFWSGLFKCLNMHESRSIESLQFVPSLIHTNKRIHYFKHSLLIGFLNGNVQNIIIPEPSFDAEIYTKQISITSSNTNRLAEDEILKRLAQGESLRSIARTCGKSIGYLVQLAGRNSIKTEKRIKFITPDIERAIWRQAFLGKHRSEISINNNCSIAAVEKIIQSHKGLSKWRSHLRRKAQLRKRRTSIINFINKNPNTTRGQVQNLCRSDYIWLYRFDNEWLYKKLPPKLPKKYQNNIDWITRDRELARRIELEIEEGKSLTAIDRQLGSHGWLTRRKERFPGAVKTAIKIIKRSIK